jgi:hypothetical protein
MNVHSKLKVQVGKTPAAPAEIGRVALTLMAPNHPVVHLLSGWKRRSTRLLLRENAGWTSSGSGPRSLSRASTSRAYRVKVQVENILALRVRVAQRRGRSTILVYMTSVAENCLHLGGLRVGAGSGYLCSVCGASFDLDGVARWVREAERARDKSYSLVEGDEFGEIVREELQREVYRRRRVMYDLQSVPRVVMARPEMILVIHDARSESYECRIFYKEPRPAGVVEQLNVEEGWQSILELRTDPDPVVRLASEKVEEFHLFRRKLCESGAPAPGRRVFYTNEF